MNDEEHSGQWHLDKRIPAGTLIGLVLQAVVFAVWVGAVDNQVETNKTSIVALQKVDASRNADMRVIEGRLSALETTAKAQLKTLERIERILDRSSVK